MRKFDIRISCDCEKIWNFLSASSTVASLFTFESSIIIQLCCSWHLYFPSINHAVQCRINLCDNCGMATGPRAFGAPALLSTTFSKSPVRLLECPPCPPRSAQPHQSKPYSTNPLDWLCRPSVEILCLWSCFIVFFVIEREKVFVKCWNVRRESEKGPAIGCGTGPRVWLIRPWV